MAMCLRGFMETGVLTAFERSTMPTVVTSPWADPSDALAVSPALSSL